MSMSSEETTGVTVLGDYVELALALGGDKRVTDSKDVQFSGSGTGKHNVVIGVNLSNNWKVPFDFSAFQDTECKYVESVQWLAGGGGGDGYWTSKSKKKVFLPIIEINASSASEVDEIVSSLAARDIIIPKVSLLPTKLRIVQDNQNHSNGKETFDLVLQFQLKNMSSNPEDWPNWSLQFLHNQLQDSFSAIGAQKMNQPFQVTLARGVEWKSQELMKDFLAQSERTLHSWNQRGPKLLTLSEIYLLRNGVATNYFKHNMTTPYSSKVNRCLISNVINKVSVETDVSVPKLAWYMVDTLTSGVNAINSVISPLASAASTRLQSDDLSDNFITFAEEASNENLKDFDYDLYLQARRKKVNFKGIAQEQAADPNLKMDLKLHPKMFCTKQVGDDALILGKGRDEKYRIVIPKSLKEDILQLHHDCLVNPTAEDNFDTVVYNMFTWNGIHKDVKQYVEKARREKAFLDDSLDIVPVINDEEKKKWWKSLLPKKGQHSKKNTFDSPPALVKVSDYSVSTASGLSSSKQHSSVTEEIIDDNYRLIADLPGVKPENLKVDFAQGGRVLKVSGTQQISQGNLSETNQFEKCFSVGPDLDTANAVARISNGVLIVTVPVASH
jgi:hypothetical protein